ncbi:MAG: GGDEF domain-containing protein [Myxococcales bacterium]|nr:GGDEF domain-containing protein [Myxococcales bacterium]
MSDGPGSKPSFKETRVVEARRKDEQARDRPILTVTTGQEVGRVYSLGDQEVVSIGRVDTCDIRLDDDSLSREHARIATIGDSILLQDRDSTNGSFVNDERVKKVRVLEDGDRLTFGEGKTVLRFALVTRVEEAQLREVWESTQKDGLTGLFNRKHLEELLDLEIARSAGGGGDLSVVMIDIDHFKKVNDNHGHPAGDAVLREVARRIGKAVRAGDAAARYGGEEMTLVLRADPTEALGLAERVRESIAVAPVVVGQGTLLSVTASCGVASLSECTPADKPTLMGRADARLYTAKQSGRNRVVGTG